MAGTSGRGAGSASNSSIFTGLLDDHLILESGFDFGCDNPDFATCFVNLREGDNRLSLGGADEDGLFDLSWIGTRFVNIPNFEKFEEGTWTLTGQAATTGWDFVEGGLVFGAETRADDAIRIGSLTAPTAAAGNTLTLQVEHPTVVSGDVDLSAAAAANVTIADDFTFKALKVSAGTLTLSGSGTRTFSGADISGFDAYVKDGDGTWVLAAVSNRPWEIAGGMLAAGVDDPFGPEGQVHFTGDGTVSAGAQRLTLAGIEIDDGVSATLDTGTGTGLVLHVGDGERLEWDGALTGAGGLEKTGAGTLALSGDVSGFTGDTTVTQATLEVDVDLSGAGGVTLDTGTTLRGLGTVRTPTFVDAATIRPGSALSERGTLSIEGDLALTGDISLEFDFGGAGAGFIRGLTRAVGGGDMLAVSGTVTPGGTVNIGSAAGGSLDPGAYVLMTYAALGAGDFTLGALPGDLEPGDVRLLAGSEQLLLLVGDDGVFPVQWNGTTTTADGTIHGGDGTWDTTATNWVTDDGSTALVWDDGSGSTPAGFAVFGGEQAGTVTLGETVHITHIDFAIDGYVIEGGGHSLDVSRAANGVAKLQAPSGVTGTINAPLTGDEEVRKTGDGTIVLNADNSGLTGDFENRAGMVVIGHDDALGAGAVRAMGGGFVYSDGVSNAADMTLFALDSGNPTVLNVDEDETATQAGMLSGDGGFAKTGEGTLILPGANTYVGGTLVEEGVLHIGDSGALGAGDVTFGDGVLSYADGIDLANALALDDKGTLHVDPAAATATQSGDISGDGGFAKTGDGTLILAGNNSYQGDTLAEAGMLRLEADNALGQGRGVLLGGDIDYGNGVDIGNVLTLEEDTKLNVDPAAAVATQSGRLEGPAGFTKTGEGTLILSGDNSHAGDTVASEGTIRVESNGALGSGQGVLAGGDIDYGDGVDIGNGLVLEQDSDLNVDPADATATQSGEISGDGGFTKTGEGTLILFGNNDYEGGTSVDSGTLRVTNSGGLGSGEVNVEPDGTLEYGDGVEIDNTIIIDNGILGVGPEVTDVATQAGDVLGCFSYRGPGTLNLEGGNNDCDGNVTITDGTLNVGGGGLPDANVVVDPNGSIGGQGPFGGIDSSGKVSPGGDDALGDMQITGDLNLRSGAEVVINVTPNPDAQSDTIQASAIIIEDDVTMSVRAAGAATDYEDAPSYLVIVGDVTGEFTTVSIDNPSLTPQLEYTDEGVILTVLFDGTQPDNGPAHDLIRQVDPDSDLGKFIRGLPEDDLNRFIKQNEGQHVAVINLDIVDRVMNVAGHLQNRMLLSVDGSAGSAALASQLNSFLSSGSMISAAADIVTRRPVLTPEPRQVSGIRPWISGLYSRSNFDGTVQKADYRSRAYGIIGGVEGILRDGVRGGLAGGYMSGDLSSREGRFSADVDTYFGALYGMMDHGSWWISGLAGYAHSEVDETRRPTVSLGSPMQGDYAVKTAFAQLGVGTRLDWSEFAVNPYATMQYAHSWAGSLQETGPGQPLVYGPKRNFGSLRSSVGVILSRTFQTELMAVEPYAGIGWQRRWVNDERRTTAGWLYTGVDGQQAQTGTINVSGGPAARNAAVVNAGFNATSNAGVGVGVGYIGHFASRSRSHSIMGSFSYEW